MGIAIDERFLYDLITNPMVIERARTALLRGNFLPSFEQFQQSLSKEKLYDMMPEVQDELGHNKFIDIKFADYNGVKVPYKKYDSKDNGFKITKSGITYNRKH